MESKEKKVLEQEAIRRKMMWKCSSGVKRQQRYAKFIISSKLSLTNA